MGAPALSVVLHVTLVVPTSNNEPDAGVQKTRFSQPHVTVGAGYLTGALHVPGVLQVTMSSGQLSWHGGGVHP